MKQINLTSSNNVKFRFTIDDEGTMNIKVGIIPPTHDRHIIAMEEDVDANDYNEMCDAIGSTIDEWQDCDPDEILSEEDAGQPYEYFDED